MRPMRVLPGKALPSHMGAVQVTIQNLEIIKVDTEDNCILVKGSIPGPKKGLVIIKSAVKTDKKNDAFDLISYEQEKQEEKIEENTDINEESTETESAETTEA